MAHLNVNGGIGLWHRFMVHLNVNGGIGLWHRFMVHINVNGGIGRSMTQVYGSSQCERRYRSMA